MTRLPIAIRQRLAPCLMALVAALLPGVGWATRAAVPAVAAPTAASAATPAATPAGSARPVTLRIVGGLASINQYTRHEEPFWTRTLPRLTSGALQAEIVPFDRAGIRGQDMLRLLQLGAVPFGTALVSLSATQLPLLGAMDLPGLNPDMASLRRSVDAIRPVLQGQLRQQLGIELLAVYAYPAQVLFCDKPFGTLDELRGRRVRVSSAPMADLMVALGATPVLASFAEVMPKMRANTIDCAITGTMTGNTIGLHQLASHLHPLAITWGVSVFAANGAAWAALPDDLRQLLKRQLVQLEQAIWDEADRETGAGIACNRGDTRCPAAQRGHMTVLPVTPADQARLRQLLAEVVLPRWLERCGPGCAKTWNATLAPVAGLRAP